MARPGDGSIKGLKVALLIANGVVGKSTLQVRDALVAQGAVAKLIGPRIGHTTTSDAGNLVADASLENEPGFLFDALVLPDGEKAIEILAQCPQTTDFIKDQFLHYKTILALGTSKKLLDKTGINYEALTDVENHGLIVSPASKTAAAIEMLIPALAIQRHWQRSTVVQ